MYNFHPYTFVAKDNTTGTVSTNNMMVRQENVTFPFPGHFRSSCVEHILAFLFFLRKKKGLMISVAIMTEAALSNACQRLIFSLDRHHCSTSSCHSRDPAKTHHHAMLLIPTPVNAIASFVRQMDLSRKALLRHLQCPLFRHVRSNETARVHKDTAFDAGYLAQAFVSHAPPFLGQCFS